MSQLDTYKKTLDRKREELAKLNQSLAKEQAKISPFQQRIISANNTIKRTKSESTIKSKISEIERANKSIADTQKKCGSIQKKIAQKATEIVTAEKKYNSEEAKVNKKRALEASRKTREIEQKIIQHEYTQNEIQTEIERLKAIPEKITVLFMAANPTDTPQLRLDEEARLIQEKIRLSEHRDSVHFESRWATRSSDILQAINETNPTIVHFSGHGAQTGELILLNPDGSTKIVNKDAITMAMATASDTIRLVVFNACFSKSQAKNVVEHIEAAIGMSDSIRDDTAYTFAAQLYSSIGFGMSLKKSFNQAIAELLLEGIPGENIPQVYSRDDVDLNDVILVRPDV